MAAAAPMALAAAPSIIGGIQQRKMAEANKKAQDQQNEQLRVAAIQQYDDLSAEEISIREQSNLTGLEQQKQLLRAQAAENNIAGASGTYGGSVDSIMSDLRQTKGKNMASINNQRSAQLDGIKQQAESIRYGARAQMSNRIFHKPSWGEIGLSAGVAAAGKAQSVAMAGA